MQLRLITVIVSLGGLQVSVVHEKLSETMESFGQDIAI